MKPTDSHSELHFDYLSTVLLPEVCHIAFQAGQLISDFYHKQEFDVECKADGSPVTCADQSADKLICLALRALTPDIPMVTEESVADIPYEQRKSWQTYWLVDPLDGTKEFIAGTGEYSVNIALIYNHHPVMGVVYGPETGDFYFAVQSHPQDPENQAQIGKLEQLYAENQADTLDWQQLIATADAITVANHPQQRLENGETIRVAVSRRHGGALQHFMGQLGHYSKIRMGSALKTCLVAEGKADIYPRFGPTSLWDTAAAQCILEVAGGAVLNAAGHSLEYVQTESLLNPFFIAIGHTDYDWPPFPEVL